MSIDSNERQEKRVGRRATLFSVLAAFSLLMCAAFAPMMQTKVGVPKNVVFGMAGLGGVLVLLLNLWSLPDTLSRRPYVAMSLVFLVDLLLLNLMMVVVCFRDSGTLDKPTLISISIYVGFFLLTALSMGWLIAGRGDGRGAVGRAT